MGFLNEKIFRSLVIFSRIPYDYGVPEDETHDTVAAAIEPAVDLGETGKKTSEEKNVEVQGRSKRRRLGPIS